MMQTRLQDDVLCFYALSFLKGVGPQTLLRIGRTIPNLRDLPHFSQTDLQEQLGILSGKALFQSLHHTATAWQQALEQAEREWFRHLEQGILPLPLIHRLYPPLLKLIPDAPPVLYAKGNIALLRETQAVAIVGTRQPTANGLQIAHDLAYQLAKRQYTIVSGLAKGIDGAAHQGALDARGNTIAVFGTPLDTIYPARHRRLAERILAEYGVLVSELALGQQTFQTAFVRRDRIQSGLSLAVLPIQTGNEGGTMHTIQFARTHNRLIICPKPPPAEASLPQYEGIRTVLSERTKNVHVLAFSRVNYQKLLSLFEAKRQDLLPFQEDPVALAIEFPALHPGALPSSLSEELSSKPAAPRKKARKGRSAVNASPSLFFPALSSPSRAPTVVRETQEPFHPSPDLTQVHTPFWETENEAELSPPQHPPQPPDPPSHQQKGKGQRQQRKKTQPLWEFREEKDEQEQLNEQADTNIE